MDIVTAFLSNVRIIFGFLLIMVIPGFLVSLVYYPKQSDINILERFVYATIISIGSVIVCILFMDVFLGIDTTPINIVIVITAFCVILAIVWIIRTLFLTFSVTEKISGYIKRFYRVSRTYFSITYEKFHGKS
jgi:uncharacterized membrane protein